MSQNLLEPIDRLEFAVSALRGLGDLVAAARLEEIRGDELAVLVNLVVDEVEDCTRKLRGH